MFLVTRIFSAVQTFILIIRMYYSTGIEQNTAL